jgi:hypothetical protein
VPVFEPCACACRRRSTIGAGNPAAQGARWATSCRPVPIRAARRPRLVR